MNDGLGETLEERESGKLEEEKRSKDEEGGDGKCHLHCIRFHEFLS